jgi:hypothetical protein
MKFFKKPKTYKELRVKPETIYRVIISCSRFNPWFDAILLVGFVGEDETPAGYSKIVGINIGEIDLCEKIKFAAIEEVAKINNNECENIKLEY